MDIFHFLFLIFNFLFTVVEKKVSDRIPQLEVAGQSYSNIIKIESLNIDYYGDRQVPFPPTFTWYAEGVGEIFYVEPRFNSQYERGLIDFRLE